MMFSGIAQPCIDKIFSLLPQLLCATLLVACHRLLTVPNDSPNDPPSDSSSSSWTFCSFTGCALYVLVISRIYGEKTEIEPIINPEQDDDQPIRLPVYVLKEKAEDNLRFELSERKNVTSTALKEEPIEYAINTDSSCCSGIKDLPLDYSQGCVICLDEFCPNQLVSIGQVCHHAFHAECIRNWTDNSNKSCPYCRQALKTSVESLQR